MAMTKIKGLQMWCKKMTGGYQNVDIANFTTSWRDGLAFCAIIHRFRPDLIDFDSLSSENVLANNTLAFEVAERELDIPAFLEAEDMARLKVPDRLSVITYVSQYYNFLNALPQLGGPGVKGTGSKKTKTISGVKRTSDSSNDLSQTPSTKKPDNRLVSSTPEAVQQKQSSPQREKATGDKCVICQNKVYLLERHMEDGRLYHRSCFRHSELSPTNRVFTNSLFNSPNLSSEKVAQENTISKRPEKNAPLSPKHEVKTVKDDRTTTKDMAKSNLSSALKRLEGAGAKYSINVSESKEQSKKSHLQPKSLFESDVSTAANRCNKVSVAKNTNKKETDSASLLPLSGKESRKLEERKQEILESEKAVRTNIGTKRTTPLIFQHKHNQSEKSLRSSSSESKDLEKASSSNTKLGLSNLYSKKDPKKDDIQPSADGFKKQDSDNDTISQPVPRKRSAPSITTLQERFGDNKNDLKSPVPKPRISATKETLSKQPYSNFSGLEKPSSSAESSSCYDKKSMLGSSDSISPPPLPTSPPPNLPLTPPTSDSSINESPHHLPALPSSLPSSHTSKHSSCLNLPPTKLSTTVPASAPYSSMSTGASQASPTRPLKTYASKEASLSNKQLQSNPTSSASGMTREPSHSAIVTSTINKDENAVPVGLLSSLAGIRGRPRKSDIVTSFSTSITPTCIPSNAHFSTPLTTLSDKQSKKPAVSTNVLTHQTENDSSVQRSFAAFNSKPTLSSSSSPPTSKHTDITSSSRIVQPEKIPEAFSILHSLKSVVSSDSESITKPSPDSTPLESMGESLRSNISPFNIALKRIEPSPVPQAEPKKSSEQFKASHDSKEIKVTVELNKDKAKDTKPPLITNHKIIDKNGDIPQWKKDIEERKRKQREDIARSERITQSSYTKQISVDNSSKANDSKLNKFDSHSSATVESPHSNSSGKSGTVIEKNSDIGSKFDWQLEAEKKIAAYALFESNEDESKSNIMKNIARSGNLPAETLVENKQGDSYKNKESSHTSPPSRHREMKESQKPQDSIKHNSRKNNLTEVRHHLKELGAFTTKGFSTVNIDISGEGERKTEAKDNVVKDRKESDSMTITLSLPTNSNNNSRNIPDEAEINKSLQPQIENKNKKSPRVSSVPTAMFESASSDIESRKEEKKCEENKHTGQTNQDQGITASPKLKRKITFIRKQDSNSDTPPVQRKITVDKQFDFDSNSLTSSEFEASLTQSTAEINMNDEPTSLSHQQLPQRPPRPKSQKKKAQSPSQISAIELQQQLMEIDNRLTDLELRGRDLEESIRTVNITEEDDEQLMIQWFSLVREKNELVRQEADIVYLSREQDLEGEQTNIDVQLRYLMSKEENDMSQQEKDQQNYLLQRKIDIVNQRSSIVDSMDDDRIRYEEEDRSIDVVLLGKGLTRNASGTLMTEKGLKVAKSTFYT